MIREQFEQELIRSGYVHSPLPLHRERSMEAHSLSKKILNTKGIFTSGESYPYTAGDETSVSAANGEIRIAAAQKRYGWNKGRKQVNYSNYGMAVLSFSIPGEDWTPFNRVHFEVCPDTEGNRIASLCCLFRSEGKIKTPDRFFREGATVFDLDPHVWNECTWEFPTTARDKVEELRFYVFLNGRDYETGAEELVYRFRDIRIEEVENPEHEIGWVRKDDRILYSTAGYWTKGSKTAVTSPVPGSFELVEASSGKAVYTGEIRIEKNEKGEFGVLDFTGFTEPGTYCLRTASAATEAFIMAEDVVEESVWGITNFFFTERCGYPIPGRHGACHKDTLVTHMAISVPGGGGWHDAGDMNQSVVQSAEVTEAFFANALKADSGSILHNRLMEEGRWGLDFILRTRFGDGYRMERSGTVRFTDNIIHTFDDVDGEADNNAYHNFVYAQTEAAAAKALMEEEPDLAAVCRNAAEEDFGFAMEKYLRDGNDCRNVNGHSKTTSDSLFYAVITWAAASIAEVGGKCRSYKDIAEEYAAKLIACQQDTPVGIFKGVPLLGFFYRDETRQAIVHWNHQGRENQFIEALAAAAGVFADSPDKGAWENSMRLYGEYVKCISRNTLPYGMIPAGVHRMDEPEDYETFKSVQIWVKPEEEKDNYRAQLLAGAPVDALPGKDRESLPDSEKYVIRCFPVWFSFRGNFAVAFGQAVAAVTVGQYFGDEELIQVGREQFYWLWGKNPFGQSIIYGIGDNYCTQYAVCPGESVGEIPVGMESYENEDIPYWPQNNNCTYKEVWVSAACRVLKLAALLSGETK